MFAIKAHQRAHQRVLCIFPLPHAAISLHHALAYSYNAGLSLGLNHIHALIGPLKYITLLLVAYIEDASHIVRLPACPA